MHSQLPPNFEQPIESFYERAFQVFLVRQQKHLRGEVTGGVELDDSTNTEEEIECSGCKLETDQCQCTAIMGVFHDVNKKLLEMDLLERLVSNSLVKIVYSRIVRHVEETCQGSFTISHLKSLEDWLDCVVLSWMRLIFSNTTSDDVLKGFRKRLVSYLYETYTLTRIDQLFNIIIEFPDSQPALEDLKESLKKTDLPGHLTVSLKSVLEKKLLHLGVNTTDIITAYIAAIRSLRFLDPSGVILETVCEPVRKYLRTRDDTVRCIVQNLIDDNNSELADELKEKEGLCLDESFYEEDDMDNWKTWKPDPVHSKEKRIESFTSSSRKRTSDIISMLVNIYGSKELFVNEYQTLLSNRLLSQFSFDTEKEIRNLELLKLRFGEAPLHQCEVMLKDIGDSKRLNTRLHSPLEGSFSENHSNPADLTQKALLDHPFPVDAIIVSAQFWPQLKEETLVLPDIVTKGLEVYTKAYEFMKGNRTLDWKTHLGFANIDLEIGERKINLTVTPFQAAIICKFQEKSEWAAEELSLALKIPISQLRRRIAFWQVQGLVREMEADK